MAWVRIHDGALTHPKLVGLSDKAFRLWVWGLCYCQMHLTNGVIPAAAVPRPMQTAEMLIVAKLWDARAEGGFHVHDYLDWNDSRELVTKKRTEAKERMANARQRSSPEKFARTSPEVLRRVGLEEVPNTKELTKDRAKDSLLDRAITERAGTLLERYDVLYSEHRRGARHRARPSLDWQEACDLCRIWPSDARLEKLAVIFLTTDDPWISSTDRSFMLFAKKVTWCDDRLTVWESEHGVAS